jgi:hypothetical protein
MGSVVVIRKRTSGTEADRLLRELAERLTAATDDSLVEAWHFSFDIDYATARAEATQTLDAISDTWPIHLLVEDPG